MYQPGGTILHCVNHWMGRRVKPIQDKREMGRWTGHQFRLKGDNTLVVISEYQPCKQSNATIDTAVNTVNHQQN
jgi:hypothetical protein